MSIWESYVRKIQYHPRSSFEVFIINLFILLSNNNITWKMIMITWTMHNELIRLKEEISVLNPCLWFRAPTGNKSFLLTRRVIFLFEGCLRRPPAIFRFSMTHYSWSGPAQLIVMINYMHCIMRAPKSGFRMSMGPAVVCPPVPILSSSPFPTPARY